MEVIHPIFKCLQVNEKHRRGMEYNHYTTRVTEQCDGCGVCEGVCVAVRYVGRILEG